MSDQVHTIQVVIDDVTNSFSALLGRLGKPARDLPRPPAELEFDLGGHGDRLASLAMERGEPAEFMGQKFISRTEYPIRGVVTYQAQCGFMPTCAEHDTHNGECERCKRALIAADEGDW